MPDIDDVQERVITVLEKALVLPREQIKPGARLLEDLGVTSLDRFELVMGLEEEFGIEISDEALQPVATVGDIIAYMENTQTSSPA